MHSAAKVGDVNVIKTILSIERDIDSRNSNGATPLMIAAYHGRSDALNVLIEKGSDPTLKDNNGVTLLHYAAEGANDVIIEKLLSVGLDIDSRSSDGATPLMIAAYHGRLNAFSVLIERKSDPTLKDNNGWTLLHYSARGGNDVIIEKLLSLGLDIDSRNSDGATPLMIAACEGRLNAFSVLIERKSDPTFKDNNGVTLLHYAAEGGNDVIIEKLLSLGVAIDSRSSDGATPMMIAACHGRLDAFSVLIERKSDPTLKDNNGWTLLHYSARGGNDVIIEKLLSLGLDIDSRRSDGATPLMIAACEGRLDAFSVLIERKSDPTLKDNNGWTLLHYSARGGNDVIIEKLLSLGLDIDSRRSDGATPLMIAAYNGRLDAFSVLIERKSDPSLKDNNGQTLLHYAARGGNDVIIEKLLSLGIHIDSRRSDRATPLMIAASKGRLDAFSVLIERKSDPTLKDNNGWTLLHYAARGGNDVIIEKLLCLRLDIDSRRSDGAAPLMIAAYNGTLDAFSVLIERKSDPTLKDNDGWTLLHYAAKGGNNVIIEKLLSLGLDIDSRRSDGATPLMIAACEGRLDAFSVLIERKSDPTLKDKDGWTLLHYASKCGNNVIIEKLLSLGLDIDSRRRDGATPLMIAAYNGTLNAFSVLIERKSDPTLKDNDGWTLLHYAAKGGNNVIIEKLLSLGLDIDSRRSDGATPLMIAACEGRLDAFSVLIERKSDPTLKDKDGWTLLHYASKGGNNVIIEKLLSLGLDIDSRRSDGATPLMIAACEGRLDAFSVLIERKSDLTLKDKDGWTLLHYASKGGNNVIIEKLLSLGLDIDLRRSDGATPLMIAACEGRLNAFSVLIERKSDPTFKDNNGVTLLHYAAEGGNDVIIEKLLSLGVAIDSRSSDGATPMMIAACHGRLDAFNVLTERKSDPTLKDNNGWTLLHCAARGGNDVIIEKLLSLGVAIDSRRSDGATPLMIAACEGRLDAFSVLIERKSDPTLKDNNGWTLLHYAARGGNDVIIEKLLSLGLDIHSRRSDGATPLMIAAYNGRLDAFSVLIERKSDPSLKDNNGQTLLHYAARGSNDVIIEKLLSLGIHIDSRRSDGATPLMIAASKGRLDAFSVLIERKSDLTLKDNNGWTLLHYAAKGGNNVIIEKLLSLGLDIDSRRRDGATPLMIAAYNGRLDAFSVLIERKSDPSLKDNNGQTLLHYAARGSNDVIIEKLLSLRLDIDSRRSDGATPLMIAAYNGTLDAFSVLIERKSDPTLKDNDGWTLLHNAAKGGNNVIIEKLLSLGLDIDSRRRDGATPLMIAAYNGTLNAFSVLIERKSDPTLKDNDGWTLLHYAAKSGNNVIIQKLLSLGLDIDSRRSDGATPLMIAAREGRLDAFSVLIERKSDPTLKDKDGWTLLHYASKGGNNVIIEKLLSLGLDIDLRRSDGATPLMIAAFEGRLDALSVLIERKSDPTLKDNNGWTLLHYAAQGSNDVIIQNLLSLGLDIDSRRSDGATPLMIAACERRLDAFSVLIERRSDPTLKDKDGWTLLHYAARGGNNVIIEKLLSLGLYIDSRRSDGATPLMIAACHGRLDAFSVLIERRSDPTLKNNYGDTLLHYAAQGSNDVIIQNLLSLGLDIDSRRSDGATPLMIAACERRLDAFSVLIERRSDPTLKNNYGDTLLHYAAQGSNDVIIQNLLSLGLDIDSRRSDGATPLMIAACERRLDAFSVLIERKSDPTLKDNNGWTLLHYAARGGNNVIIEKLLSLGLYIDSRRSDGATPLMIAACHGRLDAFSVLIERRSDPTLKNNYGDSLLHYAAQGSNDVIIQNLLSLGLDIDSRRSDGATPLMIAACERRLDAFSVLIERRSDPTLKNNYGDTLLHYAAQGSNDVIIQNLLSLGLDIDSRRSDGATPLMIAACERRLDAFSVLIERKSDPTLKDNNGWTLLHYAARGGNNVIIEKLLSLGLYIDLRRSDGATPLMIAACHGRLDAFSVLIERKSNPTLKNNNGDTLLHYAARGGNDVIIQNLLSLGLDIDSRGINGITPLMIAACEGRLDAFSVLIERKSNPTLKDNNGQTLLHYAARGGNNVIIQKLLSLGLDIDSRRSDGATPVMIAAREGRLDAFSVLIERKSDPTLKDKDGWTLLHYASKGGNNVIIEKLLSLGLYIDLRRSDGATPLMIAACKGRLDAFSVLIERKSNPTLKDNNRETLLHYAARGGNDVIIEKLLSLGLDIDSRRSDGATPLMIAACEGRLDAFSVLIKKKSDPTLKDNNGWTLLHYAARGGNDVIIEKLLSLGLYIDLRRSYGATPLMIAAGKGRLDAFSVLIERKSNPTLKDNNGQTLLHYAARGGNDVIIEKLLSLGLDIDSRRSDGATPLMIAACEGRSDAFSVLIERKSDRTLKDNNGWTLLHYAARGGNNVIIEKLLSLGLDINSRNSDGLTPLRLATLLLLKRGLRH